MCSMGASSRDVPAAGCWWLWQQRQQQRHPPRWAVWPVPGLTVKHLSADQCRELPHVHAVLANTPISMCQGGQWNKAVMVSLYAPATQEQPPSGSSSLLVCWHQNTSYRVREGSLIHVDRWVVSMSSWLKQKKSPLSQIHHVLNWSPSSSMAPLLLQYTFSQQLYELCCPHQPRPSNVILFIRDSVSWQHVLESWQAASEGSRL